MPPIWHWVIVIWIFWIIIFVASAKHYLVSGLWIRFKMDVPKWWKWVVIDVRSFHPLEVISMTTLWWKFWWQNHYVGDIMFGGLFSVKNRSDRFGHQHPDFGPFRATQFNPQRCHSPYMIWHWWYLGIFRNSLRVCWELERQFLAIFWHWNHQKW